MFTLNFHRAVQMALIGAAAFVATKWQLLAAVRGWTVDEAALYAELAVIGISVLQGALATEVGQKRTLDGHVLTRVKTLREGRAEEMHEVEAGDEAEGPGGSR